MKLTHAIPEIYNPHVSYEVKCKIIEELCCALAVQRGVTISYLRNDLKKKINVDFKNLKSNPVGMLLIYEYIFSLCPSICYKRDKGPNDKIVTDGRIRTPVDKVPESAIFRHW